MKRLSTILSGVLAILTGCSSITTEDYADKTPVLDIREYLNGPLEAWGVIKDYTGKADTHFHVKMEGSWNGNEGTLKEWFTYSDGTSDTREWSISFSDDHHFTATAHDVVGEAKGSQHGNAMNMRYTLRVPRGDSTIDLSMDDWMYRIDDKVLINHTKMRKLGITVGELVISFRKGD